MFWKVLGSLLLLKYGITLSQFLWMLIRLYFLPRFGMKKNLKKYGSWAVVTGATDGIGKAIAKQLAKRGINIVLISRSNDKLKAVAEEFQEFNVEVKTITFDFSDVSNYEPIRNELQELDIGILVNNVGISYPHPDFLMEVSDEFCDRLVNINVFSLQKMTRIVLEGMSQRKRGLIVHLSSASGLFPMPLLSLYSASKVFVNFFSKALQYEYARSGVHNQVLTPFLVATNLSKARAKGMNVPSADCFAKMAVDTFGLTSSACGWWTHDLHAFAQSVLPEWFVYDTIFKTLNKGRQRWLRKQQQKKEE